jgi:hypothetical protein
MILTFQWPSFTIYLPALQDWLQTNYASTFDGITADDEHLQIIFSSTPPETTEQDIQAYLDSLSDDTESLKRAIEIKNTAINALRDKKLNAGFTYNGNVYDSTGISRLNISGAVSTVLAGQTLPSNFTWRTLDNQNIPMNNQQMVAFGLSMSAWTSQVYGVSWYHKANISTMTSTANVDSYDITVGWPT